MRMQLTGTDVSTAKEINFGYSNFKLIESPQGIAFYDERNDDGLFLRVESNHASIIKDIKSYLDEEYEREGGKFTINDITDYVWQNKLSDPTDKNIYSKISEIGGAYLNIPGREVDSFSFEQSKKSGYVQGVCECVAVVGKDDNAVADKLLKDMNVTRGMAKEYASPDTYKELEKSVFAPKRDQKREGGRHR